MFNLLHIFILASPISKGSNILCPKKSSDFVWIEPMPKKTSFLYKWFHVVSLCYEQTLFQFILFFFCEKLIFLKFKQLYWLRICSRAPQRFYMSAVTLKNSKPETSWRSQNIMLALCLRKKFTIEDLLRKKKWSFRKIFKK